MASKSFSTRRATAASTVSQQAVVVNTGTGNVSVAGGKITSTTPINLNVVTSGQSSSVINTGTTITSYTVTDNTYTNLDDTAVDTGGGYIKINGTGFTTSKDIFYDIPNFNNITNKNEEKDIKSKLLILNSKIVLLNNKTNKKNSNANNKTRKNKK
mgnify:CR=1 FL=1